MEEYILSICIPTYNRCYLLKETIDNLISQIGQTNYKIEICISDNSSKDDTATFLKNYEKKHSFIKTNINKYNFGYDYNLCQLINMAHGSFVWILSDDDIVLNHCVEYLGEIICRKDFPPLSVIFLKPVFAKKDYINEALATYSNEKADFSERILTDPDTAFMEINWLVSLVSSFVLKKDLIGDNFLRFLGSGFVHIPMILNCMKSAGTVITNNPHLLCRQNNGGGYNIYHYFGTNFMGILLFYKKQGIYKSITIDYVVTEWLKNCVRGNVIYCKLGYNKTFDSNNKAIDLIRPYWKNHFFLRGILPILLMPPLIFKMIAKKKKWK